MDHVASLSSVNLSRRAKPLILIVDDDRSLQMLLTVAIEQEGIDTVQASSGDQCLHDYQRLRPDMVLLDAVMPGMDGFECCRKLRQLNGAAKVPILMITVLDSPEYVEQAFQAGATDYITKPIQWAVLSHRVHRLLDAYQNVQKTELTLQALQRHQTWEQLQRQLLKSLREQSLDQFLTLGLEKLRDFLKCDRTLLFQCSSQTWLAATDRSQEHPELQLTESNDFWVTLTKPLQPSWISGSPDELLPPLHQDICKKLQCQSLGLYPIVLDGVPQAYLFVGHHHIEHPWLDFEQDSIQTIAELMTISFQLNRSLVSAA